MKTENDFADIGDPLIVADLFSETMGGGSNTVGALGNGRLTVGISPWGEMVYFRWPRPSHYDHLRYVTHSYSMLSGMISVKNVRHGKNAPSRDWQKYGRPLEKYSGLGGKAGIYTRSGNLYWMDDPVWDSSRWYEPENSDILTTTLRNNENQTREKIQIAATQWVDPEEDIFYQRFSIRSTEMDSFFYYATFAPWMTNPVSITNPDSPAGLVVFYDKTSAVWYGFILPE